MKQNLSELISTRLSHDVIGNVGAVANAVELMEEGDVDFWDDIKSILKNNAAVLMARLKFFRLAFGLYNANLENQDVLRETTSAYLSTLGSRNTPINLEWTPIPSAYGRAALLGVMTVADTLIRGGTISVRPYQKGISVVHNEDAQISAEKVALLKDSVNAGETAADAQLAPLAALLALVKEGSLRIYLVNRAGLGFVFE